MRTLLVLLVVSLTTAIAGQPAQPEGSLVLVVGATGKTGDVIARAAAAAGYQVRATTRDLARAPEGGGYSWVALNAKDPDSVRNAMAGVRFVVSSIGARTFNDENAPVYVDYLGVANLVDAAAAADVEHFVLVSSAAAGIHRRHEENARMGYVRYWKTLGEQHLKASGLNYTVIGPGGLTNQSAGRSGLKLFDRRGYRRASTSRADVARVAIASFTSADADNKSFALVNHSAIATDAWIDQLRDLPRDVPAADIERLGFMNGYWRAEDASGVSEETWLPPAAGTRFCVSRSHVGQADRVTFEFLQLVSGPSGITLFAQPGGSPPTAFQLTDLNSAFAVFSRSADDFPAAIIYRREDDTLKAQILGRRNDAPLTREWQWQLAPLVAADE